MKERRRIRIHAERAAPHEPLAILEPGDILEPGEILGSGLTTHLVKV